MFGFYIMLTKSRFVGFCLLFIMIGLYFILNVVDSLDFMKDFLIIYIWFYLFLALLLIILPN